MAVHSGKDSSYAQTLESKDAATLMNSMDLAAVLSKVEDACEKI
jgi:hypothetical protein